ncbi:biotin--[acetyl-CoA-carboxylase] ligase [Planctomicrobium sp.]|jgi:BirA family transcriptional regulator, biotin operon repressor / biotin---[acetyl-CoA-carboxylase] ligase|nr:biotin--[acetyl-CoA-carboxylase] ligase [Planctomicrobium sp.]MDB4743630.1 biotin--[acetyl-CoA-carboxylase] ligase [Planctomicrobium sp.]
MPLDVINYSSLQVSTFIKSVEWLVEVDSTNTYVLQNLKSLGASPALVGADLQTGGRGRGKNQWWGAEGSLTFTLLLQPNEFNIQVQHWPLMSLMVGLAVREGLLKFLDHHQVSLKWPNDVYVDDKKICGILIETTPAQREFVVIGIGLNINNSLQAAPLGIQESASSMLDLTGCLHSREEVLTSLLQSLEDVLVRIPAHLPQLLAEWRQHCFLTGKRISIDDSQHEVAGQCLGIDDDGGLVLQTESGQRKFLAGSVTVLE